MQERRTRTIYKLYNKNFIALQLNIEHIRNKLRTIEDRCTRQSDVTDTRSRPHLVSDPL